MSQSKKPAEENGFNEMRLGWEEWVGLSDRPFPLFWPWIRGQDLIAPCCQYRTVWAQAARVRFSVFPYPDRQDIEYVCKADVIDERRITSSNGQTELRPIIKTTISLGGRSWEIGVSLTNREESRHMLLGRTGLPEMPGSRSGLQEPSRRSWRHLRRKHR